MNSELVGEPAVSAFLRSLLRNLGDFSRMKPADTTDLFYTDLTTNLEKLKEKLIFFEGLVVDGEAKRLVDPCVDQWMDDLNDLLYHVEDFLDDIRRLSSDQVRNDLIFLQNFCVDIKSRFEKIILARAEKLEKFCVDTLKLERGRHEHASSGEWKVTMRSTPETSSVVDISEIHGREKDRTDIVNRLLEVNTKGKKKYDVVGIWGMGGLGKTTLAQLVFNDPQVVKHFEVRRWVCISDVFDVSKAIKGLIKDDRARDAESLQILHERLQEKIQNKRFLFVLDDMWPSTEWKEKWNMIRIPFNSCQNGSKILVTTRDCNIARALGDEKPYQLEGLPHEQCMLLFEDNADVNDGEKEKLMKWGEKIVRACKGVPLAVKVIGSMLQTAKEEKWRAVSENTDLWDTSNIKDGIHPAIRLSYHYLPASLKRCFQYLAIFPPDYEFQQKKVVRLWIAEGLVEEVEGRRVEHIGNEYYNELEARSLIQKSGYAYHTMHDIIQHLATVVSRKFCYKENSKENPASVRHAFLVNRNSMHYEFLAQAPYLRTLIDAHEHENIGNLRSLRVLCLRSSSISGLPESICSFSQLQVITLSDCKELKELPKDIGNLRSLSELHLVQTSISSLPESICSLCELQVLDLEYCRELKELPKDIGNLRSLSELHLVGASISSLPESICSLSQLQVLRLSSCRELKDLSFQLPLHIGRLEGLVMLPLYPVEKEEGRRLGELSLMNRLSGGLTIARMENIGGVEEAEMADLKSKKNLRNLTFRWSQPGNDEEMEVKIMDALEPYHALESLKFDNYGGNKFPSWMMAGNICWSNLTLLIMEGLNKICEMINMEFMSLGVLMIKNCPKLRKIVMATPKLRELYVDNCGELEADCVHLLPSLSDKVGPLSIVSQLTDLKCEYKIFEYFFEKLKTQNSKWDKLRGIKLNAGGRRVASLPGGWPSMMDGIERIEIGGIGPGKFRILLDGDQSAFPPSLFFMAINNCKILPDGHHRYTITSDGEVNRQSLVHCHVGWKEESSNSEEESMDNEEVEQRIGIHLLQRKVECEEDSE